MRTRIPIIERKTLRPPKAASVRARRLAQTLDSYRRRGITEPQIRQIRAFVRRHVQRTGEWPRRWEIRAQFPFLRFEPVPQLIPPVRGLFKRKTTYLSRHETFVATRKRELQYARMDKMAEKRYRQRMDNLQLATLTHNWKYWAQHYYSEKERMPTEAQIQAFIDLLAKFIQTHPNDLTPGAFARFNGHHV